ncbi:MAG TPA: anhydro-N-acetylmuramic acid kinase [Candidatus Hydrogenedentes bacterium]|nr:anhydro-N-acetylmuramic acid kinase [Candidatus Hydrogenedentota bacterium]HOV72388.1 anhydro-N-acetylmuramic acid kinase [Candidatus Hydrogenedentota bacterium]HPC16632.1 anhydro-N-acetylmuramic acid kinase [Candidatus Hydrogenedentota bacterium]HRT63483.1 anhydro-N-acetylmuramic acid kinase [Candidatus Hydrogenedentota bacterium]
MDLNAIRNKPMRFAVGLMSGTSCDGISAALVRIKGTGDSLHLKFIKLLQFPYPSYLRNRLLSPQLTAQDICLLNFELGSRFADAVLAMFPVAKEAGCTIDFVASHGHTVAHVPPRGEKPHGTLQIGEPAIIAERTGLPVISDFRTRDMAAGGQGAPLVPYADWVLFARPDRSIVCLNIGGIANVTVVTPNFDDILAFDTGPGNMIIDGTVGLLTRGEENMDTDGKAAAEGVVIEEFLDYLLSHPYFDQSPPKSTGREEFGIEVYLRDALMSRKSQPYENLVATVTAAVAKSIVNAFDRFIKPKYDIARVVVSGGGAYNKTLLAGIREGLPNTTVRTSEQYGIPSIAREAVAFAILGNETICGTPANVPQATGARHAAILGKITPGV